MCLESYKIGKMTQSTVTDFSAAVKTLPADPRRLSICVAAQTGMAVVYAGPNTSAPVIGYVGGNWTDGVNQFLYGTTRTFTAADFGVLLYGPLTFAMSAGIGGGSVTDNIATPLLDHVINGHGK